MIQKIIRNRRSTRACTRNTNNLALCKRSQDEMIGFVLIVVIVVVVALILLGLTLRKGGEDMNNKDIENFLEASMLTTTGCAINFVPAYDSLQDLVVSCYENRVCEDGKQACNVLNSSLSDMINRAFIIGEGGVYKAYYLEMNYATNDSMGDKILSLGDANCSKTGALKIIPAYPGEIIVEMDLCVSE